MSEAINLTPTSDVDTPRTPVETPVPPLDAPISITKADLSKMLQDAVAAGRADPNAGQTGPAVYPEVVEVWTKNELIRRILGRITWFSERDQRAAYVAADTHFADDEDDVEESDGK